MKKIAFLLLFCFSAVMMTGCESMTIRYSGGPKLIMDDVFGVMPDARAYLSNTTPFYVRIVVLGESFDVDPGCSIYDSWQHEFYRSSLPVVVRVFSDPRRRNLIGIVASVLTIGKAYTAFWPIRAGDVNLLNENYRSELFAGLDSEPDTTMARKVNFPTIKTESTTLIQFINLTPSEVSVLQAGPMRSDLARNGASPQTYGFVKNRLEEIEPFGCRTFDVDVFGYDQFQYGQSVMYWAKDIRNPVIVGVWANLDQGPRAVQYFIR